jgi:hypothetical protein
MGNLFKGVRSLMSCLRWVPTASFGPWGVSCLRTAELKACCDASRFFVTQEPSPGDVLLC